MIYPLYGFKCGPIRFVVQASSESRARWVLGQYVPPQIPVSPMNHLPVELGESYCTTREGEIDWLHTRPDTEDMYEEMQ